MEPYQELEQEIAKWAGYPAENVVGCSSGTAALHLALESFRLPKGSKVITSDFNMIAVPRAIVLAGLSPVFVDCDDKLLMDSLLVPYVDENASAIVVVHIYGRQLNFDDARNQGAGPGWCWKDGLRIVEDLAEAHGIKPQPGTDAACWSFYRNKIVAGEEGGAVAFRDPKHASLARSLRSLGFTDKHDFTHLPRGHNYRLSNSHARIILDGLKTVEASIFLRRQIEGWYNAICPHPWKMPERNVPWVYDLRVRGMKPDEQDRVVRELQVAGIPARHAFKPMSLQEEFYVHAIEPGVNALRASTEIIYLPIQPGVTSQSSVRKSFDVIRSVLADCS